MTKDREEKLEKTKGLNEEEINKPLRFLEEGLGESQKNPKRQTPRGLIREKEEKPER